MRVNALTFEFHSKSHTFTQNHTSVHITRAFFTAITRYTHTLYTRLKHTRRRIYPKKVRKIEGPVASAASGKGPPTHAKQRRSRVKTAQSQREARRGGSCLCVYLYVVQLSFNFLGYVFQLLNPHFLLSQKKLICACMLDI